MISNLKLGLKVLRHGYGIKMNLLLGALFLVLGGALHALGALLPLETNHDFLANFLIMCVGMLPAQMLGSLPVANMVQASPQNRKLQTSVPAAFTWCTVIFLYLVCALIQGIMAVMSPEKTALTCVQLVTLGIATGVLLLLLGVAYKYFVVPILLFFLFFFFGYYGIQTLLMSLEWGTGVLPLVLAAAAGLACITAGGCGQYLLSLAVYRKPCSKLAQPAPLRKEL